MTRFLASNWIWILLIGGMLFMHLGHRHGGHMGGGMGGGRGGGHAGHEQEHDHHGAPTESGSLGEARPESEPGNADAGNQSEPTPAQRHGGC